MPGDLVRVMINGARSRKIRLNPGFGGMSAVLGAGEGSQMEVEEARTYEPPASDAREVGTARGIWNQLTAETSERDIG